MNIPLNYALATPLVLSCSLLSAQNTPPQSPAVATPGASAADTTVPKTAEGYNTTIFSNGSKGYFFMLDSGEFWFVAFPPFASDAPSLEVIHGIGTIKQENVKTTFTANGSLLFRPAGPPTKVDVSASSGGNYGTISTRGAPPVRYSAGPVKDNLYDTPYQIDKVAGHYVGGILSGSMEAQISIDIDSSGRLSGSLANCSITGQARQRNPSKNPYETSIRFTGPQCALGSDTTIAGVMAVVDTAPGQTGQMGAIFVGVNESANRYAYIELIVGTSGGTPPGTDTLPDLESTRRW